MSLTRNIVRLPRPFDPELGREACAAVPGATGDLARLIEGTAGSSPYLKGLIEREADWLPEASEDPVAAISACFEGLSTLPRDQLKSGLRQAKRRVALITALADPPEEPPGVKAASDPSRRHGLTTFP